MTGSDRDGLLARGSRRPLVGVIAAAFTLRLGIVTIGPLIERIRADTGMSSGVAGMLGTIPFLCMGVFAFVGIPLVRRMGARRLIGVSLAVIVVGTLVRAIMPSAGLIIATTFPLGIGIALAGMALPTVVKEHFPSRPGAATGVYVAALSVGAGAGALLMVPVADALGDWRWALALSAIPSVIAIPLWLLVRSSSAPTVSSTEAQGEAVPLREIIRPPRHALRIALVFGAQSMCFAAVINWIAALYTENGWSEATASLATAAVPLVTIPASLIVPRLSDGGDRRRWIGGSSLVLVIGMFGLAFIPTIAPWLWIISFSAGAGSVFPLGLTLPLDLADEPHEITRLSAWMLGLGYGLSAAGPVLVGALRDLTGGFAIAFAALGVLAMCGGIAGMSPALAPRRSRAAHALQPEPPI